MHLFDRTAQRAFVVPVLDQFVAQHVLDHHPGADLLRIGKQLPDRAHQLRDPRVALPVPEIPARVEQHDPRRQDLAEAQHAAVQFDTPLPHGLVRLREVDLAAERHVHRPDFDSGALEVALQLTAARLDLPIVGHLLVQEQRRRADLDGVDASPLRLGEGFVGPVRHRAENPGRGTHLQPRRLPGKHRDCA
mgnify:FL=1